MSTMPGHLTHADQRPERSRNAKAQARHRAKRKAYIEQLEQTVTKLQTQMGYSPDDIEAMPPPLARIRELEHENTRLERENDELRRLLAESGRQLPLDFLKRNSPSGLHDRSYESQYKKRRLEDAYASPSDTPPHTTEHSVRPPQLSITTSISQYPYVASSNSAHSLPPTSAMYTLQAPAAFHMPNTPSGSSATSSPPFSPAQMQDPIHSSTNHRSQSAHMHLSYHQPRSHYDHIKVEEDNYVPSNHPGHHSHAGHYSVTHTNDTYAHASASQSMDWNYGASRSTHHLSR